MYFCPCAPRPPACDTLPLHGALPIFGAFLEALTESVTQAISSGPIQIPSQLADAVAAMDAGPIDDATFDALVSLAGLTGQDGHVAVPDQMASINALLDGAPARLRETLLTAFLDRLTR